MSEPKEKPWYYISCISCDWARSYSGKRAIPLFPWAQHLLEKGHSQVRQGLIEDGRDTPEFSDEEWVANSMYSEGFLKGQQVLGARVRQQMTPLLNSIDPPKD